jgi:predicted nucleic acid-binding protein
MLVVDASVVIPASGSPDGFEVFSEEVLVAPPLLWSESRSAVHEAMWRREISRSQAEQTIDALEAAPISRRSPRDLGARAWALADDMGWAKTYDAEYLALAQLIGCRMVTMDGRLRRGADRLGLVFLVSEL